MNYEEKTCTCCTCGYQWERGQHGGHSCSEHLKTRLDYLYVIIGAACSVWRDNAATSVAMGMSMDGMKRAFEREKELRGDGHDVSEGAAKMLMGEVSAMLKDVMEGIDQPARGEPWMTEAMKINPMEVRCPICDAEPGQYCKEPCGDTRGTPHSSRVLSHPSLIKP